MSSALIGHTGFLGGNLARQFSFDECYHSTDIAAIRGRQFDLLVSSGVTAMKWWANQNPAEDRARIDSLLGNLARVRARRVVVLSTVDVYPAPFGVDETFDCHSRPNHAYGTSRLYFEEAMRRQFGDITVVRIAGVFGPGLKKNVIYDLLHDHCLEAINPESSFQYYNVANLWRDLQRLDETGIRLINFVSEPIRTADIIGRFFPAKAVAAKPMPEANYDVRTLHSREFDGPPHYLAGAGQVMWELGEFVKAA
jgi:NAD dependent epimerase/dehydratase family